MDTYDQNVYCFDWGLRPDFGRYAVQWKRYFIFHSAIVFQRVREMVQLIIARQVWESPLSMFFDPDVIPHFFIKLFVCYRRYPRSFQR